MIKKNLLLFPVTGLLITCNWSIYIWAVNADYVIQTCVGYYIEPLVVCLFGLVLFRERLTRYKMGAMLMALVGIVIILFHFGELPTIALYWHFPLLSMLHLRRISTFRLSCQYSLRHFSSCGRLSVW